MNQFLHFRWREGGNINPVFYSGSSFIFEDTGVLVEEVGGEVSWVDYPPNLSWKNYPIYERKWYPTPAKPNTNINITNIQQTLWQQLSSYPSSSEFLS